MVNQIKYIDLFAGIGGFHQAMNTLNAECVFSSEWDDKKASRRFKELEAVKPCKCKQPTQPQP